MVALRFTRCLAFWSIAILVVTPAWSNAPVRLNAPLISLGDVAQTSLQLSPDGNLVLYLADQDVDGTDEVFIVPIAGGTATKVSDPLQAGTSATSARFSPSGARIVYHANRDNVQHIELYSTWIGAIPVKLNGALAEFGDVGATLFTADGDVVYVADQDAKTVQEIYSVPIDGGEIVKLNGPLASTGDALLIDSDLENDIVIYVADPVADQRMEVYGASLDGSQYWQLSAPLQTIDSSVNVNGVRVTPGGQHVVYLADMYANEVFELFSVPAVGGASVPLSPPLVNGGDVLPNPIQFSPLGDRVLYLADQNVDEMFEIFTVPVTGGPSTRVNGTLIATGDVREDSLQFSDDGSKVLYIADQLTNEVYDLFVAPSTGGNSLRLNSPLVNGGDVTAAAFSSDGEHVVYLADQRANDVIELFSVSTSGGDAVRLCEALSSTRDVSDFEITPDGQYVVFLADQEVDERIELYLAPIAGGSIQKLNSDLPAGGDVRDWLISPDGEYVVYRADQYVDDQYEIFSVSLSDQTPGDYNGDGVVDAADYTVWRDGLGGDYEMQDYGTWKAGFGGGSASGSAATTTVPEPSSVALWAWLVVGVLARINRESLVLPAVPARTLP